MANLRAENYGIKQVDKHTVKGIAGKIIPALATSTAIVAGLVSIELYKLCQNFTNISKYKDTFMNLALPFLTQSEPKECSVKKYCKLDGEQVPFTLWDYICIDKNVTLQELLDIFEQKYQITIDMINYNSN